jgi:hypothetical protein
VPILSILGAFFQMGNLPLDPWIRFVVWLLIGFAAYYFYSRASPTKTVLRLSVRRQPTGRAAVSPACGGLTRAKLQNARRRSRPGETNPSQSG